MFPYLHVQSNKQMMVTLHQNDEKKKSNIFHYNSILLSLHALRCIYLAIFCGVHSTPMLPQWQVKDPGHSAKSAGGRIYLNTRTPLTQRSMSGLTMPLSRHSVGRYQETSSHTTHQGTLSHSCRSSLSHYGLILA